MKYQGSYCALITPFKDDIFDEKSFIKIIEWHIKQGTQGYCALWYYWRVSNLKS